jgi:hypothetical protein
MLRHRANHGFTPIIGSSRSLLPPHPGRDAGVRVKVDDDLADQAGLGALEPGLQRQRLVLSRLEWLTKTLDTD